MPSFILPESLISPLLITCTIASIIRQPRRSLVTHCLSSEARFHPTEVSYIYSRYRRVGDDTMDESFFPILWTRSGYRTPFLDRGRSGNEG